MQATVSVYTSGSTGSSEGDFDDGVLHMSRGDSKLPTTRLKRN